MPATVKPLKELYAQIQAGDTYEESGMYLLPFESESLGQMFDAIEDPSNVGVPFSDIPQQGTRHVGGDIGMNLDSVSCVPILEAAFGANNNGVFTLGQNEKKLSVGLLNAVNFVKYANVFVKNVKIEGASNGLWSLSSTLMAVDAQSREAITNKPSSSSAPSEPFTFHETGGSGGFFRVGDSEDALSASDEFKIDNFSLEITCGFEEQYCNEGIGTLTPVFGMVQPEVTGSFTVSRYENDAWNDWRDNHTPLQLSLMIYKSVTENILIEIPRFVINNEISDDIVAKQNVEMNIGRNGVGTTYKNSNMSFTSPVRISVTNS